MLWAAQSSPENTSVVAPFWSAPHCHSPGPTLRRQSRHVAGPFPNREMDFDIPGVLFGSLEQAC